MPSYVSLTSPMVSEGQKHALSCVTVWNIASIPLRVFLTIEKLQAVSKHRGNSYRKSCSPGREREGNPIISPDRRMSFVWAISISGQLRISDTSQTWARLHLHAGHIPHSSNNVLHWSYQQQGREGVGLGSCFWLSFAHRRLNNHQVMMSWTWASSVWTWASSVPRWPRRPMASWLVSGIVWPAGVGRWSHPCTKQRQWPQVVSGEV